MMPRSFGTLFAVLCATLTGCPDAEADPKWPGEGTTGSGGITVSTAGSSTGSGEATGGTTAVDPTTGANDSTGVTTAELTSTGVDTGASTGTSGAETTTSGASTGSTGSTGPDSGGAPVACEGQIWACGDGIDNDGDGKIDNADFECISPCDDDEASFQTDLPGQAEDCKNDCYWDADSGAGQDKCQYDLKCDAQDPGGQIGCGFAKECPAQTPAQCLDTCVPLIPNGCDCFGCCHVDTPDGVQDYYLDSSDKCSLDNLGACNHCTFQEQCANPCEGCEVCFGEKGPPEGCDPGDGGQCEDGVQTCTMGGGECPEYEYCQTGCCKAIVPG